MCRRLQPCVTEAATLLVCDWDSNPISGMPFSLAASPRAAGCSLQPAVCSQAPPPAVAACVSRQEYSWRAALLTASRHAMAWRLRRRQRRSSPGKYVNE